jgi:hypothetical protein
MRSHPQINDVSGCAALAICESLLLALTDLKVIAEHDLRDLLNDAAAAHRAAAADMQSPEMHEAVAAVIERILASKNSVRRKQ